MLDTTNNHTTNIDSLKQFVIKYHKSGDREREMAAYAELGHAYQLASLYGDAVMAHQKELNIAEELGDTLMMATAMNDMGVNYRRIGLFYHGLDYHSRAIETASHTNVEDKDKRLKCQAIGYNGLGNIYINIENYDEADRCLRQALDIETKMGSHLGMNVDNANLGMIFERRGMTDSAWVYFKRAYEHSKACNSITGISYCHMHFGRLYQTAKEYDKAKSEFQQAIDVIKKDEDNWYLLQPYVSMAKLQLEIKDNEQTSKYLGLALSTAKKIHATEYLAQIYDLYAKYYQNKGDHKNALDNYLLAKDAYDSLINTKNIFEIGNLRNKIIKEKSEKKIAAANNQLAHERVKTYFFIFGCLAFLFLALLLWYVAQMRLKTNKIQKNFMNLRERFFTNITHEFRTPLTIILGKGQEIAEINSTSNPEKIKDAGNLIVKHGNSLLNLVNQLLDISKVKSEIGEANWCTDNLRPYLQMIVEECMQLAKNKHITMKFAFSEDEIIMDFIPDYIRKILINLINNAVKFTPESGNVSISCKTEDGMVKLMVADNGYGMTPEVLNNIYEPFYQAEEQHGNIGTGVGLSLVKQLVAAMNGKIDVESTVNVGTVFTITIPMKHGEGSWKSLKEQEGLAAQSTEISNLQMPADAKIVNSNKPKVLIVEDNADIARYIGEQLPKNYLAYYAENGKEGLKKANELIPDIILTDLMMPVMDGLQLCRLIRANRDTNTIPVIVITAKTSQADLEVGLKAGANAYLFKPFSGNELRIRIESILNERHMLHEKFLLANHEINDTKLARTKEDQEFISHFTNLIYDQMREINIDLDALAMELAMSKSTLQRKVTSLTGNSLTSFISKIRTDYAQQLLKRHPDLTISEVAMRCGFSDPAYFSRIFKQNVGVSPAQYRKNIDVI